MVSVLWLHIYLRELLVYTCASMTISAISINIIPISSHHGIRCFLRGELLGHSTTGRVPLFKDPNISYNMHVWDTEKGRLHHDQALTIKRMGGRQDTHLSKSVRVAIFAEVKPHWANDSGSCWNVRKH